MCQIKIRYLRCTSCQREFSERKGTSLWNSKISEAKAISIAEHLSEGNSLKGTARLVKVTCSTVRRLCRLVGQHAQAFHGEKVQNIAVNSLHADERWGFVANKKQQMWEAEVIDPASKFVLSHVQGERNSEMIQALLEDCASRLSNRHEICLFTDGFKSYATHFPAIFGIKENKCSCEPDRYRIPRSLAHVQVSKEQSAGKLKRIQYVYRHGTKKRVHEALLNLVHTTPNTSIIERRNLTARSMNATQVRKSLAFGRHPLTKYALGRWTTAVYNWCRTNRMLKEPIVKPTDKKKYVQRTPAMALHLTDHVWSAEELMKSQIPISSGWG